MTDETGTQTMNSPKASERAGNGETGAQGNGQREGNGVEVSVPESERPRDEASSRRRVLDSAIEEFAAYGYAGARIDRIAKRVALNVRMIYYHFGSKEGLYQAALGQIARDSAQVLRRIWGKSPPEEGVSGAVSEYFEFLTANPAVADLLVHEFLDGAEHMRSVVDADPELRRVLVAGGQGRLGAAGLVPAQGAGGVRGPSPESLLLVMLSAMFLVSTRHVHELFLGRQPGLDEWKQLFGLFAQGGFARAGAISLPGSIGGTGTTSLPRRRATTAPMA